VDNPPVVNDVKAGQSIPVKFSLGGNLGLGIIAAGYPVSSGISPASAAVPTNSNSGLSYDSANNQYSYVWKTDKSWKGTTREFKLRLTDGTDHVARFSFK
jgi:hypothetical protein